MKLYEYTDGWEIQASIITVEIQLALLRYMNQASAGNNCTHKSASFHTETLEG